MSNINLQTFGGIDTKLCSITAHNKYGISRSALTYIIQNQFYFDKDYTDCLDIYYILQWEPSYFLNSLDNGMIGVLNKKDNERTFCMYQVIYHQTDPTKIRKAISHNGNSHVKLSFRVAHTEFNIQPIVLIKLYTRKMGDVSE